MALASTTTQAQEASAYRLGPRDQIAVEVFEEPRLDVQVRVSEDGTVRLPLVGDVPVEGLTAPEAAQRLKQILERDLLQRASVTLQITEFRSRPISVLGAVLEPGTLDISGRLTLLEAIVATGGLAQNAGETIYVLRRSDNGLTDQVAIPVRGLMVEADPSLNIPIFANDLINIPPRIQVTVYCLGEVQQPGEIAFDSGQRITLLAAVARAGGLTDRAAKKILIKRPGPRGAAEEIEVDYRRILAGKAPDPTLRAGDVIVVRESFF